MPPPTATTHAPHNHAPPTTTHTPTTMHVPLQPCMPPRRHAPPGKHVPPGKHTCPPGSMHLPPPGKHARPPPVDRHTPVNILPCLKLRLRAVKKSYHSIMASVNAMRYPGAIRSDICALLCCTKIK